MSIDVATIERVLTEHGYIGTHETVKRREFQKNLCLPLYVKRTSKTGKNALIAHPHSAADDLRGRIGGVAVSADYRYGSNMGLLPERRGGGKDEIHYGWGVTFESSHALVEFLDCLEGEPAPKADKPEEPAPLPSALATLPEGSDAEAIAKRRIGHDLFKGALVRHWRVCAVTGLSLQSLLRASHIKPWAPSSPAEKTDLYNGLLLAPHVDAAFDAGLISFDDCGTIVLSARLPERDAQLLGLRPGMKLRSIDARHLPYLAYHRREVFQP